MHSATVSLTLTRSMLRYAVARGADLDALCAAAGITPAQLASPDERITGEASHAAWQAAVAATRDDDFGLHLGEMAQPVTLGLVGFVMLSSNNLGEALGGLLRYTNLLTDGVRGRLTVAGSMATLEIAPTSELANPLVVAPRQRIESTFSACLALAHALTGANLAVTTVGFMHPAPVRTSEHRRIFRATVVFDQPVNRLCFAATALDRPLLDANPTLRAAFETQATELLAHLDHRETWTGRTQRAIARRLRGEAPALEAVAQELGLSVRSLQRHLTDEGTSFRAALDRVREASACRHLANTQTTVDEVSFLLGFSEASAFHRSFKRWTGLTPQAFRSQAIA